MTSQAEVLFFHSAEEGIAVHIAHGDLRESIFSTLFCEKEDTGPSAAGDGKPGGLAS